MEKNSRSQRVGECTGNEREKFKGVCVQNT
jgi:hypothetical protein